MSKKGWGQLTWRAPTWNMTALTLVLNHSKKSKISGSKSNFPNKKKVGPPKNDLGGFAGRVKIGDRQKSNLSPC